MLLMKQIVSGHNKSKLIRVSNKRTQQKAIVFDGFCVVYIIDNLCCFDLYRKIYVDIYLHEEILRCGLFLIFSKGQRAIASIENTAHKEDNR